jgi:hypothetical protein
LPPKRWKKSRKFRQIWGKCIIDPTINLIEHHYIAWKFGQAFKNSLHESICSTYMFMFIQGMRGVSCLIMVEGLNGRRRWTANFEIYSP